MEEVKVINHKIGMEPEATTYKEIHENTKGMSGVYLKLISIEHKSHYCVKEIEIGEKEINDDETVKKIDIRFSKDTELFAISYQVKSQARNLTYIKVLKCGNDNDGINLTKMFENYEKEEFTNKFEHKSTFVENLTFDMNKVETLYLVGYGET